MKRTEIKKRVYFFCAFAVLALVFSSCLWIRSASCPEAVGANSSFEVVLELDDRYPLSTETQDANCYGYLGVQIPIGWTINAEDASFVYHPLEGDVWTGEFEVDNTDYKGVCETTMTEVEGYYWVALSTLTLVPEAGMDYIEVKFKVNTDGQTGDKFLVAVVNENGADSEGKKQHLDAGKIAPRNENDLGEGCTYYAEIAVTGSGSGIKTLTKDNASFDAYTIGNGQLAVELKDGQQLGANLLVYNTMGQIVENSVLDKTKNLIVGLTPGVYAVAVQKDGIRSLKKVIVR